MDLVTEIEIGAPAKAVWRVLTDFRAYPSWNPFIRRVTGDLREGGRLEVVLQPEGGKAMAFRPRLQRVVPDRELRWMGRVGIPGIFDGRHEFRIEPLDDSRVRFVQRESFSGLFVPSFKRRMLPGTQRSFHAMNQALKQRAEAFAARP